jgi:translation initiation factor IF-1
MHGGPWLEAYCFDGVKRMCHICGKMGRKVRIAVGDIVLISLRGFQVRGRLDMLRAWVRVALSKSGPQRDGSVLESILYQWRSWANVKCACGVDMGSERRVTPGRPAPQAGFHFHARWMTG